MTRPRSGIGSELLPVGLVVFCLVGTLFLVISMHRRGAVARALKEPEPPQQVVTAPTPAPQEPAPPPPPPPPAPREDPTKAIVTRMASAEAEQVRRAELADARADGLEKARLAALAESEDLRRRTALARSRADDLNRKAEELLKQVESVALERDVLARERDAAKAALAKARKATSYAILPHKGPNGTWRRPIVIECSNGSATLQPSGQTFSLVELSGLIGRRASPIVLAVAREMIRVQRESTSDGAPSVPYIFFVIRPDGIRPYYAARERLEPLGIAFGYELVDQSWEIDYSDPDRPPDEKNLPSTPPLGTGSLVVDGGKTELTWPGDRASRNGLHNQGKESVESFVWPRSPSGSRGGPLDDSPPGGGSGRELAGGGDPERTPFPKGRTLAGPEGSNGPPESTRDQRGGLGGVVKGREDSGGDGIDRQPFPTIGGESAKPRGGDPFGASPGRPSGPIGQGTGRLGEVERTDSAPKLIPLTSGGLPPLEPSGSGDGTMGKAGTTLAGKPIAPAGKPDGGQALDWPSSGQPGGAANRSATSPPQRESASDVLNGMTGVGSDGGAADGSESRSRSGAKAVSRTREKPPLRIDVPFEITVACRPDGVLIHPGGYRLTPRALKEKGTLAKELKAIVQIRRQVDPLIHPLPSLRFVVQQGGYDSYWEARRQTLLSQIDWPSTLQLGDANLWGFASRESSK